MPENGFVCWGVHSLKYWDEGVFQNKGRNWHNLREKVEKLLGNPRDLEAKSIEIQNDRLSCTVYRGLLNGKVVWYVLPKGYMAFGYITGLKHRKVYQKQVPAAAISKPSQTAKGWLNSLTVVQNHREEPVDVLPRGVRYGKQRHVAIRRGMPKEGVDIFKDLFEE